MYPLTEATVGDFEMPRKDVAAGGGGRAEAERARAGAGKAVAVRCRVLRALVSGSAGLAAATAWSITERREGAFSRTCGGTQVTSDLPAADVLSGHVNWAQLRSGRCTKGGETGKAT